MADESSHAFLAQGQAVEAIHRVDWSRTSMGALDGWSPCVRSFIETFLLARQPMLLLLGADFVQVYNDAFIQHGLSRHPEQMGRPYAESWPEVFDRVAGQLRDVFHRGVATLDEDRLLGLVREGRLVDTYWCYGCTPLVDEAHVIRGVVVNPVETTQRVLLAARRQSLERLSAALARVVRAEDIGAVAAGALALCPFDHTQLALKRAGWKGGGDPELSQQLQLRREVQLEGRLLLPVRAPREAGEDVEFVAFGLDPALPHDEAYRAYLRLLAERIANTVDRLEAERMRAVVDAERNEMLSQVPVATAVLTGPRLVFSFINDLYCELVGKRDLLGWTYEEALPELAGTELPPLLHRLYETGETYVSPETLVQLDRSRTGRLEDRYVRFTLKPMKTLAGEVFALMCVAVDVTDEALGRERLEEVIRERTADLARSRDQAESANRAKSAFLANMSHEIRTPLNAIIGMTHLLSRKVVDGPQRDQLGKVDAAAKHLLALISDILDLSKIEAGKMVIEKACFASSEVVDWALEMVRDDAAAKQLSIVRDTAQLPPFLRGDSLRLSQILINLLSNAVKFTGRGFVMLRAGVVESVGVRRQLRFEIQDSGIGIPEDKQPALFRAFEQADGSTSRQYGGTGLGLALSRQLARAMGGETGFSSRLGVGSTFWFTVWLEEVPAEAVTEPVTQRAPPRAPAFSIEELEQQVQTRHAGQRVLLAEDNPVNCEVGVSLLESVGLVVDTASDGAQAIAKVRAGAFDLVLMDMQMPKIDGIEATRAIRAEMISVPIVAMTANAFVVDRHACLAAGMDDHLPKPVDPHALYSLLLRWLPPGPVFRQSQFGLPSDI